MVGKIPIVTTQIPMPKKAVTISANRINVLIFFMRSSWGNIVLPRFIDFNNTTICISALNLDMYISKLSIVLNNNAF